MKLSYILGSGWPFVEGTYLRGRGAGLQTFWALVRGLEVKTQKIPPRSQDLTATTFMSSQGLKLRERLSHLKKTKYTLLPLPLKTLILTLKPTRRVEWLPFGLLSRFLMSLTFNTIQIIYTNKTQRESLLQTDHSFLPPKVSKTVEAICLKASPPCWVGDVSETWHGPQLVSLCSSGETGGKGGKLGTGHS